MIEMMMESIVIAFIVGGIMGAVTALHLRSPKITHAEIKDNQKTRKS